MSLFSKEVLELRELKQPSWTSSGGLRSYNEDARLLFKLGASALPQHCPMCQITGHLHLEPHTKMVEIHGGGTFLLREITLWSP